MKRAVRIYQKQFQGKVCMLLAGPQDHTQKRPTVVSALANWSIRRVASLTTRFSRVDAQLGSTEWSAPWKSESVLTHLPEAGQGREIPLRSWLRSGQPERPHR